MTLFRKKKCIFCGKHDNNRMKTGKVSKHRFSYHESCVRPIICEPTKYKADVVDAAIEVWFAR